jgi:hypothetical protein
VASAAARSQAVQRLVDLALSDTSANGKYIVERKDPAILYSTLDAAPPEPYALYARGEDAAWHEKKRIPLNSWKPNVRFLERAEAKAEPVIHKPGTYTYKTKGMFGIESSQTYSIESLQNQVINPEPGLDGPPLIGALGKNDCNIWATTLQHLIAEGKGPANEMSKGRKQPRALKLQSPTTAKDLRLNVGDLMKHVFEGTSTCRYHAATVAAKDGASLITLEANVDLDLSRPQFHIHNGLAGFAAAGIQEQLGDKVEVVPVKGITYDAIVADKEIREGRFQKFGAIDPEDWEYFEKKNLTYRNRLAGEIGITSTAEKARRDQAAMKLRPEFDKILYQMKHHLIDDKTYTHFPRID